MPLVVKISVRETVSNWDASIDASTLSPSSYNDSITVADLSLTPTRCGSFDDDCNPCQVYGDCDACVHDVCSAKHILTKQSASLPICVHCRDTDPKSPTGGCYLSDLITSFCTGPSPPIDLKDASAHECSAASHKDSKGKKSDADLGFLAVFN